jgi:RNA polymerase sigma-70 factor, ECF subfamily
MAEPSASEFAARPPIGLLRTWRQRRPERALVRAARRGDPDAAEELARRHWPEAVHAAYLITGDPATAEDVAQASIVAALQSLDSFDLRRAFRPWFHRIVANRAIDALRARDRRREVDVEAAEVISASAPNDARVLGIADMRKTLDPPTRAIVVLRCLLDYRSQEIAEMLGLNAGAVRTRLHRALNELRSQVGDEEDR